MNITTTTVTEINQLHAGIEKRLRHFRIAELILFLFLVFCLLQIWDSIGEPTAPPPAFHLESSVIHPVYQDNIELERPKNPNPKHE